MLLWEFALKLSLSLPARMNKTNHCLSTDKYSKMELISASIFTIQIWKWISGKTDWKEFDLEMRVRFFITVTENLMWVRLHHLNVIGYALRGKRTLGMGLSSYFYFFFNSWGLNLEFFWQRGKLIHTYTHKNNHICGNVVSMKSVPKYSKYNICKYLL